MNSLQVERVLVPDGAFLGAMFGNETVYQLRVSLQQAELERTGEQSWHSARNMDSIVALHMID